MLKKVIFVVLLAFIFNWAWEIVHSTLYVSYKGGPITDNILLRAALVDASIILLLVLAAREMSRKHAPLLVVLGGLIMAVSIEWWALATDRWVYDALMPIIPLLSVGLTPAVQLAVTGYFAYRITFDGENK